MSMPGGNSSTLRKFATSFLAIGIAMSSGMLMAPASAIRMRHDNMVAKYLLPKLSSAKKVGRIYYKGACDPSGIDFPIASMLNVSASRSSGSFLNDLHGMLSADEAITVMESQSVVRIAIGTVPNGLLNAEVGSLTLKPMQQYNRTLAFSAIEEIPEVQSVAKRLGLRPFPRVMNELMVEPRPDLPHLPAKMSNITVDRFLDIVANTFGGVVYYGVCEKQGFYSIDYIGGAYFQN